MRRNTRAFMVYTRESGGIYITKRCRPVPGANYRWVKSRTDAARLSRNAAIQIASYYGGCVVPA